MMAQEQVAPKKEMFSGSLLLCGLIIYRLVSVHFIKTWFVPDEFWQSLEVSHNKIFGYGYLTWEWKEGIRSCFYPSLFMLPYSILKELKYDSVYTLTLIPRYMQAILSAFGDYSTVKLAGRLYGTGAASWTTLCVVISWFLFYTAPRTLYNTAEGAIVAIGYACYPWPIEKNHRIDRVQWKTIQKQWVYFWIAALSCMIRPTAVVLWLPLILWHIYRANVSYLCPLIIKLFLVLTLSLGVQLLIDFKCYGYWVFTPYMFLWFNVVKDVGTWYGVHSVFWYFFRGFPAVMSTLIIPFLFGTRLPKSIPLVALILWYLLIHSMMSHKEFRFLLPIMPLALTVCGNCLSVVLDHGRRLWKWFAILILMVGNIPLSIYTSTFHQRGTMDVIKFVTEEAEHMPKMSVLFLMPCHSTPFYSHVHKRIEMTFLTCDPDLRDQYSVHTDEADIFYSNPMEYLESNYGVISRDTSPNTPPQDDVAPTHIIIFNSLGPQIRGFLDYHQYNLCFDAWHTDFPDNRVGQYVQAFCRPSKKRKNSSASS